MKTALVNFSRPGLTQQNKYPNVRDVRSRGAFVTIMHRFFHSLWVHNLLNDVPKFLWCLDPKP